MRKLITVSIISIFCVVAISAMAQEQTLISGKIESGGFGGPVLKVTEFRDQVGLMVGGRGGWIINHVLAIGGGGYGLTTNIDAPVSGLYMDVDYGGGILEYIVLSDKAIHASVSALIGAGTVDYREQSGPVHPYSDDEFFVVEPCVELMLNVATFFRIGAGVSYRYVNGIDWEGLSDSDISGLSATVTFKFGKF